MKTMTRDRLKTDIVVQDEPPFGSPYMLALAAISGPDRHALHRLVQAETVVGRADEADIAINDQRISSKHFRIKVTGAVYSLEDLGSTNGTRVNETDAKPGFPVRLKNLDEILVGRSRLLFIASRFRAERDLPPR